ncbi:MAG: PH domain-containing protein [Myxococcota bacterium]|jgi:uncharacterized membrane protein YdbT with pleckstrin-like domain|nr:PH domain-containing protein [Myxococcota bacterium]
MIPAIFRASFMLAVVHVFCAGLLPRSAEWLCSLGPDVCRETDFVALERLATHANTIQLVIALLIALSLLRRAWRLSGTHVRLSSQRLVHRHGHLARSVHEIDLRMLRDSSLHQSTTQRLLGIGTLRLVSRDPSHPILLLHNLPEPEHLREQLRAASYQQTSALPWIA